MTAEVVQIDAIGRQQPRAVQIPEQLTDYDVDDVLYGFGFEYFGSDCGTQRLVAIDDDMVEDYGDALQVMRAAGAHLALYDRDENRWVALLAGDWVVDPQDGDGDGFIKLSPSDFADRYRVRPS